jgi:hypothetical protein
MGSENGFEFWLSKLCDFAEIVGIALVYLRVVRVMVNNLLDLLFSKIDCSLPAFSLLLFLFQSKVRTEYSHKGCLAAVVLQIDLNRNHYVLIAFIAG